MTWSFNAVGHHNKNYDEWREDEYSLLRSFVDSIDEQSNETVTSTFRFQGNHITANSLQEAREILKSFRFREDNAENISES